MVPNMNNSSRTAPGSSCPQRTRRGSVYLLVLGTATLLTIIGLSIAVTSRLNIRHAAAAGDADESAVLGVSALELAVSSVNNDASWRSARASDVMGPSVSLGQGKVMWKQVDEVDGDIANNPNQPVRLWGKAIVGNSTRQYSIQVTPAGERPLPVLSTTLHSETSISVTAALSSSGGPISCDGTLTNSSSITSNVEAAAVSNTGSIAGFVTQPSPGKSVPGLDVGARYLALSTEISYNSIGGGKIDKTILSASANPYGAQNPLGIYYIRVPSGKKLEIREAIVQATLLVELVGTAQLEMQDLFAWEPPAARMPSLIAYGGSSASVLVKPKSGTVDVPLLGANILGIVVKVGSRGKAPSEMHGLFHVMGNVPVAFEDSPRIVGTFIADGPITVKSSTQLVSRPSLVSDPPVGYTVVDPTVTAVPGSFRWE